MQLLNDFYTLQDLTVTGNSISCKVSFNAAHRIFMGHFPGNPIVPGVCSMQLMMDLLQRGLNENLQLIKAPSLKFMQLITPAMHPEAHITWTKTESSYTVNASLKSGLISLFKMTAVYAGLD